MTPALILLAAASAPVAEVPLVNIHQDPARYEGQTVMTCGDAAPGLLLMRGWREGRSRGGMRTRGLQAEGYACFRVNVEEAAFRVNVENAAEPPPPDVVISHPPVLAKGWRLNVLSVLSSRNR